MLAFVAKMLTGGLYGIPVHHQAVTPDSFTTFGELLQYLRRRAELTQRELAAAVGYHYTYLSRLERNERIPDATTVLARFVPALQLEDKPKWVARLVGLAAEGRREALPDRITVSYTVQPQLVEDGEEDSPALHVSGNLPLQLTTFIGREREVAEVKSLLSPASGQPHSPGSGESARLVTLTGPGGSGKTRLALEVATELASEYAHGGWFVELASLSDPTLAPQAVAQVLEIPEHTGRPLLATLGAALRPRFALLVLDNCEHVVEAVAQLAEALLRACPHLHILATSREALGVPGERVFLVPALSLPDARAPFSAETIQVSEAVQLFVERTRNILPAFTLADENAPAVAQICQCLDGIPLALELAAARVKMLGVEALAGRLAAHEGFRLLTAGSRTAQPRQQTLQALIDWSHDLLSEPEQVLLRRLSIFAGGWTLEAAETILDFRFWILDSIQNHLDVLDLLTQLVNKSLVIVDHSTGEPRYYLLETIRQYAREKLEEAGELVMLHNRHLAYYADTMQQLDRQLQTAGSDQALLFGHMEMEHHNVRAALDWAWQEQADAYTGLRLAGAMGLFWAVRAYLREGVTRLLAMLDRVPPGRDDIYRIKALHRAGMLANYNLDYELARRLYEESIGLARRYDNQQELACALWGLGFTVHNLGDLSLARTLLEEGLAVSQAVEDLYQVNTTLTILAAVLTDLGEHTQADQLLQESLAVATKINDTWGVILALDRAGWNLHAMGDYATAQTVCERNISICRELGNKLNLGQALANAAMVSNLQDDYVTSAAYAAEALALFRDVGDFGRQPFVMRMLGYAARQAGDYSEARACCIEGLEGNQQIGHQTGIIAGLVSLASVAAQGNLERAARLCGAADALLNAQGLALMKPDAKAFAETAAAARAQLNEAAFARAWAEGQAMTLDQAIAYAVSD
ncbi:MAG: helix-turn-helix domain-containing protein [Chloroflexi bacterium]|nr:helix-turn-helix domain-containing protein [Chloroflexota bacterium]MCI0575628.1 helix-turn-helix domain-containing protein [Chloroflexota bacterium]MCI0648620.1 helix-turn-helix domain-containing protein [Chloroflexota bacterium]MCI0728151.1 helix-turn-helix domain-containing protein [Chloroflexota bacterium]